MSGLTLAQKKIVIGSFLGWSLDGYDIVLMLLVVPSISQLFFPSENQLFSILATFATYTVTLIMRPLGGAIFGLYGDKFGRKKSMVITIESIPKQKRGLVSGFLQSGFSFGFLLAAIVFQMVTIQFSGNAFDEWGWRVLFFTGIIPGIVALFVS